MTALRQTRPRILCVEDTNGDFLEALLQPSFNAVVATTLREGIQLARRSIFDLYLLDYGLPDGDGFELCLSLRRFDPNTPIIIYASSSEFGEWMDCGPHAYLVPKSTHPDYLIQSIVMALEQADLSEAAARAAEIQAVRDELRRQLADSLQRAETLRRSAEETFGQIVRLETEFRLRRAARDAFSSAGGTRARFERLWAELQRDLRAMTGPIAG
jgi:DNA-binding response OmpR family regulator